MTPPSIFVLRHTQNVDCNEQTMLRLAAAIPRGRLRSLRMRLPYYRSPVSRRRRAAATAGPPPPPNLSLPLSAPLPAPPAPFSPLASLSPINNNDDDDDYGGGGGYGGSSGEEEGEEREEREEEVDPSRNIAAGRDRAPSPLLFVPPMLSQAEYDRAQFADQPRLPWAWAPRGKATGPYIPVVDGKWWSGLAVAMPSKRQNDAGHIGRIMETELGVRKERGERCSACEREDEECWVYSAKGAQQVSRPGDSCARCRVAARAGGCSLSKRRKRDRSPPPPGPRSIRPFYGSGPPPPPAGGCGGVGITV